MKIYKNEKGQTVIDGCGITKIDIPHDLKTSQNVSVWLAERLQISSYPPENIIVCNFTFDYTKPNNVNT